MEETGKVPAERPGALSIFSGLVLPLAVAAGFLWFGRPGFALFVATIGLAILLLRVVAPRYGDILMSALGVFGAWLGRMVSAVLLTTIYFTVFTPVAFIARYMGRDPLSLKPDHDRSCVGPVKVCVERLAGGRGTIRTS